MINTDRIVPITTVDLISMYAFILTMNSNNANLTSLAATDTDGDFEVTDGTNPLIANEPVESVDIASDVSAVTLYFVPAYDYVGFTVNGSAATIADNDVIVSPDGRSLYKAVLSSGTITITKVSF